MTNGAPIKDIAQMWGDFSYYGLSLLRKTDCEDTAVSVPAIYN